MPILEASVKLTALAFSAVTGGAMLAAVERVVRVLGGRVVETRAVR
jgi:hypothetical protein